MSKPIEVTVEGIVIESLDAEDPAGKTKLTI